MKCHIQADLWLQRNDLVQRSATAESRTILCKYYTDSQPPEMITDDRIPAERSTDWFTWRTLLTVNSTLSESVTNATAAHFHFHGPDPTVSANTAQLYGRRASPTPYITVTFPAVRLVPNCTQVGDKDTCVNNLPNVATWQCIRRELNQQPHNQQSGMQLLHDIH